MTAQGGDLGGGRIRLQRFVPNADVIARFMADVLGVELSPWQRHVLDQSISMGLPLHELDPGRPVFILAATRREAEQIARMWEPRPRRWTQLTRAEQLRGTRQAQVIVTPCHVHEEVDKEIQHILARTDAEVIHVVFP